MSFGEKLFTLRLEKQITQEVLAEKLDVSVQTIHRWEHDKSAPNVNQLKILCEVLGVKSEYFFEEIAITQATVCESDDNTMLFVNKLYYWVCLIPWFIMFAQSLHEKTGLLFCIGSCIVWSVFTLSQELLFRLKTAKEEGIQYVLNIVKTLAIMAIALYSMFKNEQLIWKILFIFVCCMSTIICIWEIILIKYEYKNRRN